MGELLVRYEESGIDERILRAVEEMGFVHMTPIQEKAIPVFLEGRDVIGQAQTGTGKTAAFGIPMLQKIDEEDRSLQGMILCPTRELAMQAAQQLRQFAKYMHNIRVLAVYGGQDINRQIKALKGGVQIIVGTPGRVMDHMRRHTIRLDNLKMVVLDEADEMLNMGFREDMEAILGQIPCEHQTALFSATMPEPILQITDQFQTDAEMVKVVKKELTVERIRQYLYYIRRSDKEAAAARLIEYYNLKRGLIFCNTKSMVDELAENLKNRGIAAEGLHGDLSQAQRDTVMNRFRSGNLQMLIATDVAARGIDVNDVDGVINYDVPQDIEYYVHRIGRTGRAGKEGMSFTLASRRESFRIREIERVCKTKLEEKHLPSGEEVRQHKEASVLQKIREVMEEANTADCYRAVERFEKETGISAIELAAAFLYEQVGGEPEEIVEEPKVVRRDGERRFGDRRRDGSGSRSGGRFGDRDQRGGRFNDREVYYDGKDIRELGEVYRSKFGFLPQDFGYHRDFTVKDYLEYMAALKDIPTRATTKKINYLLDILSLSDVKKKKISNLSGGMKRRVGIAQAMLNDPEILVMDEPTAGLDPGERVRLRNFISEFSHDRIVLISTHIVSDIEYISTRNAIMKAGEIVDVGTTAELVKRIEGKVWNCIIPTSKLPECEMRLRIINQRGEDHNQVSIRYLSEHSEIDGSVTTEPRLEDLYLWLFPQTDLEKEER